MIDSFYDAVGAALKTLGYSWTSDNEAELMAAKHPATAHLFLNYLFRTEANAMLCEWIGYPPVHKHVMELMSDEMKAWPGFVMTPEYLEKCDMPSPSYLTGKGLKLRQKIFEELKR
jgi:spermidine/putrescine-binding protein